MTTDQTGVIAVICRLNQARSIIASAYLSRILPDYKVVSAGIQAPDGQRIPLSVQVLAQKWGLELNKDFSQSLDSIREEILAAELVIVAENSFIEILADFGVNPSKIVSMQDQAFDPDVIPIDPVNLNPESFEVELAKAVMVSVQLVAQRNLIKHRNKITVVHPQSISDFQNCLLSVNVAAKKAAASVLVADFRYPQNGLIERLGLTYKELTINQALGAITTNADLLALAGPCLVATRFEIDFAEEFVLSTSFLNVLEVLSQDRELFVITGPRSSAHREFSETYLCASNAF